MENIHYKIIQKSKIRNTYLFYQVSQTDIIDTPNNNKINAYLNALKRYPQTGINNKAKEMKPEPLPWHITPSTTNTK